MPDNDPLYKDEELRIDVRRPTGGLVSMGNLSILPVETASDLLNVHFDHFCIEKEEGTLQVGNQIDETSPPSLQTCFFGYQFGHAGGDKTILRVNGPYLYKLKTTIGSPPVETDDVTLWTWIGAVSGLEVPTSADIIGSGVNLGTAIQWAERLIYADGGASRLMLDWSDYPDAPEVTPFGSILGVLPKGTTVGESDGQGYLLTGRNYGWRYTYYDPDTGFETNRSELSLNHVIVSAGNDAALAILIPKNASWTDNWSTIRIFRSAGELVNPTTAWKWEADIEGVENLDIYDHVALLYIRDGDLGTENAPDDNAIVPKCRYLIRDPSGNRIVAFGDPDNPNTYYWSKDPNLGAFPPANQQPLGDDYSDEIRGGFVLLGRIYLLKRNRGIYMLVPLSGEAGGYQHECLTSDFGCISHHSIVVVHTRAFWMSTKGAVQFSGQTPTNISDGRIREIIKRFARSPKFNQCYGFHDRKADKNYVSWVMQDPDDNLAYVLRYDLTLGSWSIALYGDEDGTNTASGTKIRCAWLIEDVDATDGEEGTFAVLTGDTTGRCHRLRTDFEGTNIYDCNGFNYEMRFATPWIGNGLDTLIPERVYFEEEKAPDGFAEGEVEVAIQIDGDPTDVGEKSYALYDSSHSEDGNKETRTLMASLPREAAGCKRFRIIWRHEVKNGRPKLLWYQVHVKKEGGLPRVRGI